MGRFYTLIAFLITFTFGKAGHSAEQYSLLGLQNTPEYEAFLRNTVFEGYPDQAVLSFFALPSWNGESGAYITKTDSRYSIVHSRASKNLWSWAGTDFLNSHEYAKQAQKKIDEVKNGGLVQVFKRDLEKELAVKFIGEWQRLLLLAQNENYPNGRDGTLLIFKAWSEPTKMLSKTAWMPSEETSASKLSSLALALYRYAQGEEKSLIEETLASTARHHRPR